MGIPCSRIHHMLGHKRSHDKFKTEITPHIFSDCTEMKLENEWQKEN